jgi:hypothetical protein
VRQDKKKRHPKKEQHKVQASFMRRRELLLAGRVFD